MTRDPCKVAFLLCLALVDCAYYKLISCNSFKTIIGCNCVKIVQVVINQHVKLKILCELCAISKDLKYIKSFQILFKIPNLIA